LHAAAVTRCEPAVPGLDMLEQELNRRLDFSGFVKQMRRRFVEVANPAGSHHA
jgi:Chromosome segregation protein Spc25